MVDLSRRHMPRFPRGVQVIVVRGFGVGSILLCFLVKFVKLLNLRSEERQDQVVVLDSQDLIVA